MRCLSCNCILSSRDATRRSASTNEFLDLCSSCLDDVPFEFEVIENPDLSDHDSPQEWDDDLEDEPIDKIYDL